jgi:hypothetical protein
VGLMPSCSMIIPVASWTSDGSRSPVRMISAHVSVESTLAPFALVAGEDASDGGLGTVRLHRRPLAAVVVVEERNKASYEKRTPSPSPNRVDLRW